MGGKGGMFDGWVLYLPAQSLVRHTYIHSPKACLNSRSSPLALCDVTDPTSGELGELICLLTRCELVMGLGFGIWGSCDWIHPPWRKVVSLMGCVLGCSRTWANPIEYGWSFSICHRASGRTHPSGTAWFEGASSFLGMVGRHRCACMSAVGEGGSTKFPGSPDVEAAHESVVKNQLTSSP